MTAPIDYNAVLADLEAKRGQLDAAITVIRALIGGGATETLGDENGAGPLPAVTAPGAVLSGAPVRTPTGIQSDTFFGLSTPAAVKKYLSMVKRPQTPSVIAQALHDGGQVHAADLKGAYTNVYTALTRGKNEFVKTRTGDWGLTAWYSNKGADED